MAQKRPEKNLLIVDDSADTRELLERNLSAKGYETFTAANVAEAMRILESTHIDLVVTDLKMPGVSGLDLVRHIKENLAETEVMMITGYPSVESAVMAVKIGAEDYLAKPFTKEELFTAVEKALEKLDMRRAGRIPAESKAPNTFGIIGESEIMQKALKALLRAASTRLPALLAGENGTGKKLFARAIHFSSQRRESGFAAIDCSGLSEGELNNLLFGGRSSGILGIAGGHNGILESIGEGTVYLGDIADLPLSLQEKLSRALEERKIFPEGSGEPAPINSMLIAGTSRDLKRMLEAGTFREDLYYKLSANTISVPPLKERGNDVIIISRHFLLKYAREINRAAPGLSEQAMTALKEYSWPGNIPELENTVAKLIYGTDTRIIDTPDLPVHMRYSAASQIDRNRTLAEIEADHIRKVLSSVDGNKTQAAEILGINRKTLREKLRQNNIPVQPD